MSPTRKKTVMMRAASPVTVIAHRSQVKLQNHIRAQQLVAMLVPTILHVPQVNSNLQDRWMMNFFKFRGTGGPEVQWIIRY